MKTTANFIRLGADLRAIHVIETHASHANSERPTMFTVQEIKPPITLTLGDYERLSLLAQTAARRMPDLVSFLTEELDRAHVLADGRPQQTVCMGSAVKFRDDRSGKVQIVTLVFPGDADISQRRISILTPVGTALLGLRPGDSITFKTQAGDLGRLTVLEVDQSSSR